MFKIAQKLFDTILAIFSNGILRTNMTMSMPFIHINSDLFTQEHLHFAHSLFNKLMAYLRARVGGYSFVLGLLSIG